MTVPPMDGALRPNTKLEDAPGGLNIPAPDNLTSDGKRIWFSSGLELHEYKPAGPSSRIVKTFPSVVSCLANLNDGSLLVGLNDGSTTIQGGAYDGFVLADLDRRLKRCPVAASAAPDGTIVLCLGSQQYDPSKWKRDLMSGQSTGSIWRIDLAKGQASCLSDGLAYPAGIVCLEDGRLLFAESWRHRLVLLDTEGNREIAVSDLPGYPGKLFHDPNSGDIWMPMFAPRSQLVEFVLHEKDYRRDMLAELDPEHWIAPSLRPPRSYREPLQGGALKQLGEMKAWAPSHSYGLVVRLGDDHQLVESFHSRANGRRHGIVSCLRLDDSLMVASRGSDEIFVIKADEFAR